MIVSKCQANFSDITIILKFSDGLFNYIQACMFLRLKLLFNFYVERTAHRKDFGTKFNFTYHNGLPVADILKHLYEQITQQDDMIECKPEERSNNYLYISSVGVV